MHDLLAPVAFLLGEWEGEGEGLWAGGFAFVDHVSFSTDDDGQRPLIEYRQQTYGPGGGRSHSESGYLSALGDGEYRLVVAEPSGITEALGGRLDPATDALLLLSTEIGHGPGARDVTAVARRLLLRDDTLVTEVDIAMSGEPLAGHTRSVLHRA